MTTQIKRSEIN